MRTSPAPSGSAPPAALRRQTPPGRAAVSALVLALACSHCARDGALSADVDAGSNADGNAEFDAVSDTDSDTALDAIFDTIPEADADVDSDVPPDSTLDAVADISPDIAADAIPDIAQDDILDVISDAISDIAPDDVFDGISDADGDAESDVETETGVDIGPPPDCSAFGPPTSVEATVEASARFVALVWSPVPGADSYTVVRDGEALGATSAPSWVDLTAEPGGPPAAVTGLRAEGGQAAVQVSWEPAVAPPGRTHTYTVVAVSDACGSSAESPAVAGARAGFPVLDYTLRIDATNVVVATTTYTDSAAGPPTLEPGAIAASDGALERVVRLTSASPTALPGPDRRYRVVARNAAGESPASDEVVGARQVETFTVAWERAPERSGPWLTLPGRDALTADDRTAPRSGEVRWYRARFDVADVGVEYSGPDAGNRLARGFGSVCSVDADCASGTCSRGFCVDAGYAAIPEGSFVMGSPPGEIGRDTVNDETQHPVTLTRPFAMQTREFTQQAWLDLTGTRRSFYRACGLDCPVDRVTWWGALFAANALSEAVGLLPCYDLPDPTTCANPFDPDLIACDAPPPAILSPDGTPYSCEGYRLPTEAEWEYAYRAGTTTALYNGPLTFPGSVFDPGIDAIGWWITNTNNTGPRPGGLKLPNAWGLFDMAGNGWELVWDGYAVYPTEAVTDPTGPSTAEFRIIRGGAHNSGGANLRAAQRRGQTPGTSGVTVTFRLVRTLGLPLE